MTRLGYVAMMLTVVGAPACYNYVPVDTTPAAGEEIQVDITDQGRVGLADRLGPGIVRIEGRLAGIEANNYVINVSAVEALRGERTRWAGEAMRLDRSYVSRVNAKELSKGRTALLAGAVAAAVIGVAIGSDLVGNFVNEREPEPPPPPTSIRWRGARP